MNDNEKVIENKEGTLITINHVVLPDAITKSVPLWANWWFLTTGAAAIFVGLARLLMTDPSISKMPASLLLVGLFVGTVLAGALLFLVGTMFRDRWANEACQTHGTTKDSLEELLRLRRQYADAVRGFKSFGLKLGQEWPRDSAGEPPPEFVAIEGCYRRVVAEVAVSDLRRALLLRMCQEAHALLRDEDFFIGGSYCHYCGSHQEVKRDLPERRADLARRLATLGFEPSRFIGESIGEHGPYLPKILYMTAMLG